MSIHRSIHDPSTHSSIHLFSQASIHPWIRHHPASSIKHHRTTDSSIDHCISPCCNLMIFRFVLELQLEPSRLRSPASCPSIIPMGRGTWNHPAKTTRDPASFGWKWRCGNCGNINTAKIATVADLLNIITKASNLKYWPQRSIPGGSSGHQVTTYVHLGTSNVHRGCLTPRALSPTQSNAPVSVSS